MSTMASPFEGCVGFGRAPALLVVDFVNAYTDPREPLYAPAVIDAVEHTRPLLARARELGLPVVFTRVVYSEHALEGGVFVKKIPVLRRLVASAPAAAIVDALRPLPGETVLTKQYASAFHGTPLQPLLTSRGVDTIVLVGCATSGCIRATAVDGIQHGFRVIVPRECVGDRAPGPHEANLYDIQAKYGDVLPLVDVLAHLSPEAELACAR